MNERKTLSMLQRVPVILAVTAASYGLQLPPAAQRTGNVSRAATSNLSAGQSAGAVLVQQVDRSKRTSTRA